MMHVAVVGCGQLSRMLALAGIPLGFSFSFIATSPDEDTRCIDGLGKVAQWNADSPAEQLFEALGRPDVVTAEKEQLDCDLLRQLQPFCPVHPNPDAFAICQDRHREKQILEALDIPTSPYVYGTTAAEATGQLPLPLVVKSCREGYDGKNQWVLKTDEDVTAFDAQQDGSDHIMERFIPFDREVSQISVRDALGNFAHYPVTGNVHEKGILRNSVAPAPDLPDTTRDKARAYTTRLMNEMDYVGVLAMECFVVGEDLVVNEIAPRVHNSGHWTQDGARTSQFENHMRAVAGLPLGDTSCTGVSGMVNLIGTKQPPREGFSENSTLHWYNKVVRPGRKLGHVNFTGASHAELVPQMDRFQRTSAVME